MLLKNKKIVVTPIKIKSGSVIPNTELWITLGSKINNELPNRANFLSKNLLHRKNIGIMVITDIIDDYKNLKELGIKAVAICSNDSINYPDDSFEKMIELKIEQENIESSSEWYF